MLEYDYEFEFKSAIQGLIESLICTFYTFLSALAIAIIGRL